EVCIIGDVDERLCVDDPLGEKLALHARSGELVAVSFEVLFEISLAVEKRIVECRERVNVPSERCTDLVPKALWNGAGSPAKQDIPVGLHECCIGAFRAEVFE